MIWDPPAGELGVFPDDSFTVADPSRRTGLRVDMGPDRVNLVQSLPPEFQETFTEMSKLDGFGLTAGAYLDFTGYIDADTVAAIFLVGPDGPIPVERKVLDEGERDRNTVVLLPIVPLPPSSQAFVLVTDELKAADGATVAVPPAMRQAITGGRFAEDVTRSVELGLAPGPEHVLATVPFTTQSVYEDADAIAADVASRDIQQEPGTVCTPEALWIRCEGHFVAVDYRDADGLIPETPPSTATTYVLPFTAWLPLDRPGPYGGPAFPTAIFGHGLGGDRSQATRLAEAAAPMGVATIAIDAVSHGEHPGATGTETLTTVLDFFAIDINTLSFFPLTMRDHFRQSTYDKLQLLRMVELGLDVDGDGTADFDPDRVMYLGVSLGGIMGPELLALTDKIGAGVLIVPGGRVSSIVSDSATFAPVIQLLKPAGTTDTDIARYFPILQTLLDRGDAATFGARMASSGPHIVIGMVIDDDTVPNSATRALAGALQTPLVPPVLQDIPGVATTGPAPISANGPNGVTRGLFQFDHIIGDDGVTVEMATHSNIGDSTVGLHCWTTFIDTWLTTGTPVIVDSYSDLGI